jgi:uncharacterized membrane protein YczE
MLKLHPLIRHLGGFLIISLGVVTIIYSRVGASPLDALVYYIYRVTPLSLGTVAILIGTLATALSYLYGSKKHILLSFLFLLILGMGVDLWKMIFDMSPLALVEVYWIRVIMALFGITIVSFGISLTITSGLAPLPLERLLFILNQKTHSTTVSKIMIEGIFLVFAVMMGIFTGLLFEQINWFTLVIVFSIGPFIGFFEKHIIQFKGEKNDTIKQND